MASSNRPGLTVAQLSRHLDVSPERIEKSLDRLKSRGLITQSGGKVNTKMPIKLNYHHSLKAMREQLAPHGENVHVYGENGKNVYMIKEGNSTTGAISKTCGYYYSATDCANYINKRNGL